MEKNEENKLIRNVKAGDENSLVTLIKQHTGTCINIFNKYLPNIQCSGTYFNDVYGEKDYVIYQSAMSFDENKNVRFSTWVSEQAKYRCFKAIGETKKTSVEDPEIINNHFESKSYNMFGEKKNEIDIVYINHLLDQFHDKRIKLIFKRRHFNNESKPTPFYKIGKELNLTAQQVINIYNRARKFLKQKLKSGECFDLI